MRQHGAQRRISSALLARGGERHQDDIARVGRTDFGTNMNKPASLVSIPPAFERPADGLQPLAGAGTIDEVQGRAGKLRAG
jgi:hypothetical protein